MRNTLENSESAESLSSTVSLVLNHTSDGSPENLGRSSVVVGTVGGSDVTSLVQKGKIFHYMGGGVNCVSL